VHRLSTIVSLVLLYAGCVPDRPVDRNRVDIGHYQVSLSVDPPSLHIRGSAQITVRCGTDVDSISLDFSGMEVEDVFVDGEPIGFNRSDAGLSIPVRGRDSTTIVVEYGGVPTEGVYSRTYKNQQVVFSDSWPDRGRGWLPGIHHPGDPATFSLSLDIPLGYEAIAAGTLTRIEEGAERRRFQFEMRHPVPTYSMAFAVSRFSVTSLPDSAIVPARFVTLLPDSAPRHDLDFIPDVIWFYSLLLGTYPLDSFTAVQIPLDYPGMENAGMAFIQADRFVDGRLSGVIAHETAHQWFGNTVVIEDWGDLWLNEGLATYLTTLYHGHVDGTQRSRRLWAGMAEVGDGREPTFVPLASPDPSSGGPNLTWETYEKAASVLHTLRLKIGDDAFFEALRALPREYSRHPLSTVSFRRELEESSRVDLRPFFDTWVYDTCLPTLKTTWDEESRVLKWEIHDERAMLAGVDFQLEVTDETDVRYVSAQSGMMQMPPGGTAPPGVRPVGVMMYVDR